MLNFHQPVILLHGFCEDSSVWHTVARDLDEKNVFFIDLPGFGQAPLAPENTIHAYAAAVVSRMDELGLHKAIICGHSLGGYVALEIAARYPERFIALGMIHSHPFADSPERITNRQRAIEMLKQGKKDMYVAQLFPGLFAPDFLETNPKVVAEVTENGKRQSAEGIIAALETMIGRRDHMDTLTNLPFPAHWLLGAQDSLIPVQTALKAVLASDVATVECLPNAGHMAMLEDPKAVVRWLEIVGSC